MNFRALAVSILKKACIFFTVITTCYVLLTWLVNGTENSTLFIDGFNLFFYFIFSLLLALAGGILSIPSMSLPLRYVIHFALCLFGFYTCFLLPVGMRANQIFIGIVFFILGYLLIMGLAALFRSRFRKNKELNEAYAKQFQKK